MAVLSGVAVTLLLFLAGCASQPERAATQRQARNIDGLPQTLLSGARLTHARSVAMAAARTKGWQITSAEQDRLVLERELPRESPQAVALGLQPGAPAPSIQVETDLVERSDGTIVALRAGLIAEAGTPQQRVVD